MSGRRGRLASMHTSTSDGKNTRLWVEVAVGNCAQATRIPGCAIPVRALAEPAVVRCLVQTPHPLNSINFLYRCCSQSQQRQAKTLMLIFSPTGNSEFPVHLTGMSLGCGRKPTWTWGEHAIPRCPCPNQPGQVSP